MEKLVESLAENRKRLARTLRWPENIGIEMREVNIGQSTQTNGLLVWVDGLASIETLPQTVLMALVTNRTPDPAATVRAVGLYRMESTADYGLAVRLLLSGWTLLLVDGDSSATLRR